MNNLQGRADDTALACRTLLGKALGDVPVEDVVLFAAGSAQSADSATKQQRRANRDEDGWQIRLKPGEPVSDDRKVCG